ncbi:MAG: hypothetical protein KDK00_10620 [Rhodobacteraceae bacterium]|nr:hypothetical protein [Paracoccaceae bacterium]
MAKRLPLDKRFNCAVTEQAYARLRSLNAQYGFGNNYCLTFLLENLDRIADKDELDAVFAEMTAEYGAPTKGSLSP